MTEPDPAAIRDSEALPAPSVCTGGEPTAKREGCEIFDPKRPRAGGVCGACGDGRYRVAIVAGDWANATVALTENISVSLPIGTVVFLCERCDHLELRDGDHGRSQLMALAIGELTAAYEELLRPHRLQILSEMRFFRNQPHPCISP